MTAKNQYSFSNSDIVSLFKDVVAAIAIKGGNRFKIIAYQNAATAAEHATSQIQDLWEQGKLDDVPGFGESLQEHLDELFTTGKVQHFETLMKGINPATFAFLDIPGVGPKTAVKLAEAGTKDIDDLREKVENNEFRAKFTPKFIENLKDGLAQLDKKNSRPKRMMLPQAYEVAYQIIDLLRKHKAVIDIEPTGSLRRKMATIGDVDLACASDDPKGVIEAFTKLDQVKTVLLAGEDKAAVVLHNGIHVDLLVLPPQYWGSLLHHFTGSKFHNIHLRKIAQSQGLSLSEFGIKDTNAKSKFQTVAVKPEKTEAGFFTSLKMQYIPPELREDTGEIEASIKKQIPALVELPDIKGDLHLHSSYPLEPSHDLGADSMQMLIKRAEELKYQYINLTDHNPSLGNHTTQQIVLIMNKRQQFIESLRKTTKIKLLHSSEIDILPDGDLAMPQEILQQLDLPICGVHSRHSMDKDQITKRVVTALENPYVKILVHPTNRLINKRDESNLDWDIIFDVVKKHDKALEINAYPDRLDLTDSLVREAVNRGIKMVISTDSHAVEQMNNMKFGVFVARRGWATKADIVNTWDFVDFARFFKIEYK